MNVEERFNSHIERTDTCWIWTGTPSSKYGKFRYKNKMLYAHRFAYEFWISPLKENTVVHHKCSNTKCVRPTHLQEISMENNVAEMFERQSYIRAINRLQKELNKIKKKVSDDERTI